MRKKWVRVVCLSLVCAIVFMCSGVPAQAWSSGSLTGTSAVLAKMGTHSWLTSQGFVLLAAEKSKAFAWYSDEAAELITAASNRPDWDETENNKSHHSYIPTTGKNLFGGDDSANKRFEMHYKNALTLYREGKQEEAYDALGRAIHYLTDMLSPPHVGDLQAWYFDALGLKIPTIGEGIRHGIYEVLVNGTQRLFAVDSGGLYDRFAAKHDIWDIGHQTASDGYSYYQQYKKTPPFDATFGSMQAVISEPLRLSQQSIAGLLFRFVEDVG